MNIVDLIIALVLVYFLVFGYIRGFIRQTADLVVLILSFILSFVLFQPFGDLLSKNTKIPESFANVAAFFIIWFVIEFIYYFVYSYFYKKVPDEIKESRLNQFGGLLPALLRGIIVVWVVLGLILILPLPQLWRDDINKSLIGGRFVKSSPVIEKYIGRVFGDSIDNTIRNFLTVKPESNETIDLGFKTTSVTIDQAAENKMLELVNSEREKMGLKPLVMDEKLQNIARAHSRDMFARGYFAHNTPEGLTPFDRMDQAGIKYMVAGENLALAPDVDTAHNGLMNSPGHRANILTPEFRKVGMGILKDPRYGEMFSQEFTD